MYILTYALQNCKRYVRLNTIIVLIITVILILISTVLVTYISSEQIIQHYQDKIGSVVYIKSDPERVLAAHTGEKGLIEAPKITREQYLEFANSSYVKSTSYSVDLFIRTESYEAVGQKGPVASSVELSEHQNGENLHLVAYSGMEDMLDFQKGTYTIIQGSVYMNEGECIVSDEFAQLNQIQVNDTISIEIKNTAFPLILKVSGLFHVDSKGSNKEGGFKNSPLNEILLSYATLEEFTKRYETLQEKEFLRATYSLKDPNDIAAFREELYKKGLSNQYNVTTDQETYESLVMPVSGVYELSRQFFYAIGCAGSILLLIISMIMIRERTYEIGVLRAMGQTKVAIMIQYLLEMGILTFASVLVSLTIASSGAKWFSSQLLQSQMDSQSQYEGFAEHSEELTKEIYESLYDEVEINIESILAISSTALLLCMIASLGTSLSIIKFQPSQLLCKEH